jgi:hypothetical protein
MYSSRSRSGASGLAAAKPAEQQMSSATVAIAIVFSSGLSFFWGEGGGAFGGATTVFQVAEFISTRVSQLYIR